MTKFPRDTRPMQSIGKTPVSHFCSFKLAETLVPTSWEAAESVRFFRVAKVASLAGRRASGKTKPPTPVSAVALKKS